MNVRFTQLSRIERGSETRYDLNEDITYDIYKLQIQDTAEILAEISLLGYTQR
jgi:hypothetical protein